SAQHLAAQRQFARRGPRLRAARRWRAAEDRRPAVEEPVVLDAARRRRSPLHASRRRARADLLRVGRERADRRAVDVQDDLRLRDGQRTQAEAADDSAITNRWLPIAGGILIHLAL